MFPVNIKKHIDDTTVPVVGEALLSQAFLHRINELATKPHLGITFQIHLLNLVWELESEMWDWGFVCKDYQFQLKHNELIQHLNSHLFPQFLSSCTVVDATGSVCCTISNTTTTDD